MKLFKYKSCEHIEDVIINSRLYCSVFNKLNDPMEWAFNSKLKREVIEKLLTRIDKESWRICCLSKAEQFGLMWSLYGDSHQGVCIEIELDQPVNNTVTIGDKQWTCKDVDYKVIADLLNGENNDVLPVIFTKSKQWEPEQEFRLVSKCQGSCDVYIPVKITRIYLGKRMSSENKDKIKKMCDSKHISIIDMSDDPVEFPINYWNDCNNREYL